MSKMINLGGQEVKGQGQTRPKLYLEAWRRNHSQLLESSKYSVSQKKLDSYKKTRPLQLIWHNFTNSQYSLIIFGAEMPYSVLR